MIVCAPRPLPLSLFLFCPRHANEVVFDSGALRDNPTRAQEVIEDLLAGMGMGLESSKSSPQAECRADDPLIQVHNSVWERIVKASPIGKHIYPSTHLPRLNWGDVCINDPYQAHNAASPSQCTITAWEA
jgi:hypothetical protein